MATKKIVYFTAGAVATAPEKADIAALNALTIPGYQVQVSNAAVPAGLGKDALGDDVLEACDFVAGTIPSDYAEVDVIDPSSPPAPALPSDQAVVADGGAIAVTNSAGAAIGSATAVVANNAITRAALPAPIAAVANAGAVTVQNSAGAAVPGTHPATVAAGVLSNVRLAATIAPVAAGVPTFTYTAP